MKITKKFFEKDAVEVAQNLLGKIIINGKTSGIIVETEAYKDDEASHGRKRTPRSLIMHNSFGKVYVYFVYGNYFCLNFTTNKTGPGAVLIRAIKPIEGVELIMKRRGTNNLHNLTNGPGKLCQALNITKEYNNTLVNEKIKVMNNKMNFKVVRTTRVGISKAKNLKWRFYIKGSEFVSVKDS